MSTFSAVNGDASPTSPSSKTADRVDDLTE